MRKSKREKNAIFPKDENTITDLDIIVQSEELSQGLLTTLDTEQQDINFLYEEISTTDNPLEYRERVEATIRSTKRTSANLLKAYQKTASTEDELSARWKDLTKGKNRKFLPTVPANSVIDIAERESNHFTRGLSMYKLLLLLFVGSFAGVVIEMFWCLITRGYIESRSGLVYGPFNLLYGAAAVVLTVSLYRFRNNGKWLSFLGSFLVGSIVEYLCSLGQELVFGSRSWDYSNMPFNLNGRICLLYSVFWGFLGILWIKNIYPLVAKMILKIPNHAGKILTWILTAFLIFNAVVSLLAVLRWSQRINLIEPSNGFWQFIDSRFPNERMEHIYANMNFGK